MRPPLLLEFNWHFLTVNVIIVITTVCGYREHHKEHYPRPKFIPGETNFTFYQGDTATLSCGVMDLGTKTVTWRRNATLQPLSIGEMIFGSNTGYEIHHPPESYYWNLLIKNVQPEHADTYECQISTRDKMKKEVTLNVLDDKRYRDPAEKTISKRGRPNDQNEQLLATKYAGGDTSGSRSYHGNLTQLQTNTLFLAVTTCLVSLLLNKR